MGELKDQADEYLADKRTAGALRFKQVFMEAGPGFWALAEDGTLWEAVMSETSGEETIEGWRPVAMTRFEEEYVDS